MNKRLNMNEQMKETGLRAIFRLVGINVEHTHICLLTNVHVVDAVHKSTSKNGTLIMGKMEKSWKIMQKKNNTRNGLTNEKKGAKCFLISFNIMTLRSVVRKFNRMCLHAFAFPRFHY